MVQREWQRESAMCQMRYDDPSREASALGHTEELLFDMRRPHPTHPRAYEKVPWSVGLTSRRCTESDTGGRVLGKFRVSKTFNTWRSIIYI